MPGSASHGTWTRPSAHARALSPAPLLRAHGVVRGALTSYRARLDLSTCGRLQTADDLPGTLEGLHNHQGLMFTILGGLASPPAGKRRKTSHGK